MNDQQIDLLIRARNAITDRRDLEYNPDTSAIDAVLVTIPPVQRNDVDLLLGRRNAVLPARPMYLRNAQRTAPASWFVSQAVTLELDPVCAALLAQHNADVDERKTNGKGRQGKTFISVLEQAQREGKV
jgi:hypothetical protein